MSTAWIAKLEGIGATSTGPPGVHAATGLAEEKARRCVFSLFVSQDHDRAAFPQVGEALGLSLHVHCLWRGELDEVLYAQSLRLRLIDESEHVPARDGNAVSSTTLRAAVTNEALVFHVRQLLRLPPNADKTKGAPVSQAAFRSLHSGVGGLR